MKRFFFWFGIIAVVIFVFVFAAYIFISALFDTEPYVPDESYLAITISGYLSEYQPVMEILSQNLDETQMQKLRKQIEIEI